MISLIVAAGILLWYAFAVYAVKYEEELRENYRLAKEIVDRWFPKKEKDKENEEEKEKWSH
jgi:hypothetical protein